MRTSKEPWFREQNQTWYVCVNDKQIPLAKGRGSKAEALKAYRQVMAFDDAVREPERLTVAQACDIYLDYAKTATASYGWAKHFLQLFCDAHGGVRVTGLKPFHVNRWINGRGWKPTSINKVVGLIQTALNYCVKQGLLRQNPIKGMERPPAGRREAVLTAEQRRAILTAVTDKPFKMFLFALGQTGCRPGELRAVTAAEVNLETGIWVMPKHKTAKKTGRPRVIYLTPPMVKLTRLLLRGGSEGPLFRNRLGQPWSKNAVRLRFQRLREKLGLPEGTVAYTYRHTYVTDALEKGVPMATVAELVGHTSLEMLERHYSHLSAKSAHLRQAAERAVAGTPR